MKGMGFFPIFFFLYVFFSPPFFPLSLPRVVGRYQNPVLLLCVFLLALIKPQAELEKCGETR